MECHSQIHVLTSIVSLNVACTAAVAGPPAIGFDVATVVSCREVRPVAPRDKRKLIEAVFKISASIDAGQEKDLRGMVYSVSAKQGKKATISGYLPKTELYSDIKDPIIIISSTDTEVSGGVSGFLIGYRQERPACRPIPNARWDLRWGAG